MLDSASEQYTPPPFPPTIDCDPAGNQIFEALFSPIALLALFWMVTLPTCAPENISRMRP